MFIQLPFNFSKFDARPFVETCLRNLLIFQHKNGLLSSERRFDIIRKAVCYSQKGGLLSSERRVVILRKAVCYPKKGGLLSSERRFFVLRLISLCDAAFNNFDKWYVNPQVSNLTPITVTVLGNSVYHFSYSVLRQINVSVRISLLVTATVAFVFPSFCVSWCHSRTSACAATVRVSACRRLKKTV